MNAIDWKTLFVSADGRLTRTPFWMAAGLLIAALLVYQAITGVTARIVTGWMIYPILAFFGVCVLAKRFHDRGRSGWYAAPVVLSLTGVLGPWNPPDLIFLGILVWAFVELALLNGEQGANRFGVNPARHPA